jgi:hypothetical protein
VPGFWEPLVSRELWDAVGDLRRLRREQALARRKKSDESPRPLGAGIVLKYPLTNLVADVLNCL